jgi:uncharacterized membrane protein
MTHLHYKNAKLILIVGMVVFALMLGTPVIGVEMAHQLLAAVGCPLPSSQSCSGVGGLMNKMMQPYDNRFIAYLLTPLVFVWVFWPLIAVWAVLLVGCTALHDHHAPKTVKPYKPRI